MRVMVRSARPPLPGSARSLLAVGVRFLNPEDRVAEAMLEGWGRQMLARNLARSTVTERHRQVRAFATHANEYPWAWTMAHADEWFADLRSVKHARLSTIRTFQATLRVLRLSD